MSAKGNEVALASITLQRPAAIAAAFTSVDFFTEMGEWSIPITVPFGQRRRSRAMFAPPPQPMSRTSACSDSFTYESPHSAMRACEPPFIPFTIIRPKKPSGLRVLLKILLKMPITIVFRKSVCCTLLCCRSLFCKITSPQQFRQSPIVMILYPPQICKTKQKCTKRHKKTKKEPEALSIGI